MHSYPVMSEDVEQDKNNFTYHPCKTIDQANRYAANRDACHELAKGFRDRCPPGRELALALTKLEEVMFWANAAIARNE